MHTGPEDSLYLYIVHKRASASTLPGVLVCSINLDSQEQGMARVPGHQDMCSLGFRGL
jgi:hypothetical protein